MKKPIKILEESLSLVELQQLASDFQSAYQCGFVVYDHDAWYLIDNLVPAKILDKLSKYREAVIGQSIISDLITKYYPCEIVVKYNFIKQFLNNLDEVCIYEMNINKSRLDIGRINGKSFAYEIKTEFDTLNKLEKQINDYSKAMEYVYVLIHEKHLAKAKKLLPEYCGIIVYSMKYNNFNCDTYKMADLSPNINKECQIKTLSSADLKFALKYVGIKKIPPYKDEREKFLHKFLDMTEFNEVYKIIVKNKFKDRWEHLKKYFNIIQPIDVQAFFNTSSNPKWIYYKSVSMV